MDVRIVLVEPKEQGNIGSVARVMKNLGFSDLYLVSPCHIGGVAKAFSSHAADILQRAHVVQNLEDALEGCEYIVGTTGKRGGQKTPKRRAITPEQLSQMGLTDLNGRLALLFGNEASGLPNIILEKTDFVVRIPSNPRYPIFNLAQSVAIILYELSKKQLRGTVREDPLSRTLRNYLNLYTTQIINRVYEQPHQRRFMSATLDRVYGKAMLSKQEGRRLISFYRKILRLLPPRSKRRKNTGGQNIQLGREARP